MSEAIDLLRRTVGYLPAVPHQPTLDLKAEIDAFLTKADSDTPGREIVDEELLRERCEALGLPVSLKVLLRHTDNNHTAIIGFKDDSIKTLRETLRQLEHAARAWVSCRACHGTGRFDHGAGEGFIEKCIYMDDNKPRHRFCTCNTCKGTGVDPDKADLFKRYEAAIS